MPREAATTVSYSTSGGDLGHEPLFEYCGRRAMGHTLIRATFLGAPVEQTRGCQCPMPTIVHISMTGTVA